MSYPPLIRHMQRKIFPNHYFWPFFLLFPFPIPKPPKDSFEVDIIKNPKDFIWVWKITRYRTSFSVSRRVFFYNFDIYYIKIVILYHYFKYLYSAVDFNKVKGMYFGLIYVKFWRDAFHFFFFFFKFWIYGRLIVEILYFACFEKLF